MSRKAAFSAVEVEKLFAITAKYKAVIECKRSDCVTTKNKEEAWDKIAAEFNAANDIPRQPKELKTKYKNVRYTTKSKAADIRRNIYGTGGGPSTECALSAVEERMLSMLTESETHGVPNTCDSDAVLPSNEAVGIELCEDAAVCVETPMPGPSTLRGRIATPLRTGAKSSKGTSWEKLADVKAKWSESKLKEEMVLIKKVEEKVDLEMKLMREKHELEVKHMQERQDLEIQILCERLQKEKLEILKMQQS